MSDSTHGAPGKKTLGVFTVVEKGNRPSIWIRIGSAFANRDGSMSLYLDAFPIGTNRLHIREPRFEDGPRGYGANGAAQATADAEVRP